MNPNEKLLKRNDDSTIIEKLDNGFVISLSGENKSGDWTTVKTYFPNIAGITNAIEEYFKLPRT